MSDTYFANASFINPKKYRDDRSKTMLADVFYYVRATYIVSSTKVK